MGDYILRPSLVEPDSTLPRFDLAVYNRIGAMGTDLTGYPVISVYEEFTTDPDMPRVGSLMQWSYDEFGIITFSTELWNPELAAGIENPAKYQVRTRSTEDEIKLLEYNDKHLGGKGFIDWTEFDHPQLGKVEIGGWTHMYTFRNPPPESMAVTDEAKRFIHDTIHTNCLFTLKHAACTPLINIRYTSVMPLGNHLYKVMAIISNEGFLPTYMTERALKHGTADVVQVALDLPKNAEVVMGEASQSIGHLAGRDERTAPWSPWLRQWSDTKKKVEWLIRAPEGGDMTITAKAQRAGIQREQVQLS